MDRDENSRRTKLLPALTVLALTVTAAALTASGSLAAGLPGGHGLRIGPTAPQVGRFSTARVASGTVGPPVATGLNAPFGVSTDLFGRVYVAESGIGDDQNVGPGRILRFDHGQQTTLLTGPPFATDVDAVGSVRSFFGWLRWGAFGPGLFDSFAYTVGAPTNILGIRIGNTERTFDLGAFETTNNPDQVNTYGPAIDVALLVGPGCWNGLSDELKQVMSSYTGIVDSDAFRTAILPDGSRVVADAAGNDIVRVKPDGSIGTLVVLPPNVVHVPKELLSGPLTEDGQTLPDCVLEKLPADGFDYRFEPVPTGIAVGPDGYLYVAELPGGEIPGAAKIVRVNVQTKQVDTFAGGFSDITDITFGRGSALYLTELFNGDIVKIPTTSSPSGLVAGTPSVLAEVPLPNGLAMSVRGTLYASILSLTPDGQVVPIAP